jgi:uncharacterized protein (TIGR00251 family)
MIPLHPTKNGVSFAVRVVPRASCSELAGFQDNALKIRITAPPVDGKANEECIRTIADFFGVKRRQVTIVAGQLSRTKVIAITGCSADNIAACLDRLQPNEQEDIHV